MTTTECTCYVTEHYRANDPACPVHRPIDEMRAGEYRAEAVRGAEDNRRWLAECDELRTVTDLAASFVEAFDYIEVTEADRAGARALLTTMHAFADTVASTCREWLTIDDRQDQVSAAMSEMTVTSCDGCDEMAPTGNLTMFPADGWVHLNPAGGKRLDACSWEYDATIVAGKIAENVEV